MTDRELVQTTMTGDQDAFGTLVERYRGMLCTFVAQRTGCFLDVEDIVQESFVRAFVKLRLFDVNRDFGSWMRGICRNALYQLYHRKKREGRAKPLVELAWSRKSSVEPRIEVLRGVHRSRRVSE